jgi:hypothetical protein
MPETFIQNRKLWSSYLLRNEPRPVTSTRETDLCEQCHFSAEGRFLPGHGGRSYSKNCHGLEEDVAVLTVELKSIETCMGANVWTWAEHDK